MSSTGTSLASHASAHRLRHEHLSFVESFTLSIITSPLDEGQLNSETPSRQNPMTHGAPEFRVHSSGCRINLSKSNWRPAPAWKLDPLHSRDLMSLISVFIYSTPIFGVFSLVRPDRQPDMRTDQVRVVPKQEVNWQSLRNCVTLCEDHGRSALSMYHFR
jgi:hypothetical protein